MDKKVFIIGLDGATWDLIDPLISEGELPTFKNLIGNGTRAVLESTLIPVSPAAWASFATGSNPNKHGIFDFVHREKGTYEPMPYNSRDRKCETLWSILSREGKKVGVLNVPGTYPVEKVNGFMVSGFPTLEELEDFTYPRDLLFELRRELGKDFRFQPKIHFQQEELFLEEVGALTDYVFQATDYLMNSQPWDFLITVFMGTDLVSHAFWKYMDSKHPRYDANAPEEFKQAIFDIYKNLDKKIDALKKNIDSDTTLLLMSDHGFGPLYYGVSINNWLMNEGFMNLKETRPTRFRHWMFRRGVNYYNLLKLTKLTKALKLSKQTQKAALFTPKSSLADLINKFFLTNKDIDWNRTVDELKDPNNNNIIYDKIYRKKEAYPLSRVEDDTPDVLFYNTEMKYLIDKFFMFGNTKLVSLHPLWSATHRHDGIFLASSNNQIRKAANIGKASICDIAPTVLHLLGIAIPKDVDGKVLRDIFKEESEAYKRKPVYLSYSLPKETEKIHMRINKLKKMGKI